MTKDNPTRKRIVAVTVDLLKAQGYHATGLNQIVQLSEAPKGSLYFHFPGGKEELVAEALELAGQTDADFMEVLLNSHDDAGQAVYAITQAFADGLEKNQFEKGCALTSVSTELKGAEIRLREVCGHTFEYWTSLYQARFERAGMAPEQAKSWANLALSTIEGALVLSRAEHSAEPLRSAGIMLRSLIQREAMSFQAS